MDTDTNVITSLSVGILTPTDDSDISPFFPFFFSYLKFFAIFSFNY